MKRTIFGWFFVAALLVFSGRPAEAQSERGDEKVFFGWIKQVELLKDGAVEVAYYPVADFEALMGSIDAGRQPDVKTNNTVRRARLTLKNPDERRELQEGFAKGSFQVLAVEPSEKRISMVYLGKMKFVKSKYYYYK